MMATEYLEHKLALLPDKPGCYIMKNKRNRLLSNGLFYIFINGRVIDAVYTQHQKMQVIIVTEHPTS